MSKTSRFIFGFVGFSLVVATAACDDTVAVFPGQGGGGNGGADATGGGDGGVMTSGGGQGGENMTVSISVTTGGGDDTSVGPGGGEMGGGGAGGDAPVPPDICPGDSLTVAAGDSLALSGDTSKYGNYYTTSCGVEEAAGAEVVYQLDVKEAGSIGIKVTRPDGSMHNAVMYLRTACAKDDSTSWCRDLKDTEEVFNSHIEAGTYWLIIDSREGFEGKYDLTINHGAASCGDGIQNPGEACDDGNNIPSDGCFQCKFEEAGDEDVCPGDPTDIITLSNYEKKIVPMNATYNSTGANDDYEGLCMPLDAVKGKDNVHWVFVQKTGTLTVTVGLDSAGNQPCENGADDPGCWDRILYVRSDCLDANSELGCSEGTDAGDIETVKFPVESGKSYWVIVDGSQDHQYAYGQYNLTFELKQ
ncbi:DUF4215 domain-containing protein [Endomicrobium sp. AH-315-J14]|nr:DUF4215 domain-containing protein [Endomicrobium sp. AH-315-J14]